MKNKIEDQIKQELESILSDIDIDGEISRLTDSKRLKGLIEREIHDEIVRQITNAIERSIFKAIQKQQPIIDAMTASKAQSLMFKIEEVMSNNRKGN